MFTQLLGPRRVIAALTSAAFLLAIPVFFDTVFFLLVPLARSMYRRTGKHYLKYLLAIPAALLLERGWIPQPLEDAYESLTGDILERVETQFDLAQPLRDSQVGTERGGNQSIHGP